MKIAVTLLVVILACTVVLAANEKPKQKGGGGRGGGGKGKGKDSQKGKDKASQRAKPSGKMCGEAIMNASACCLNVPKLIPQSYLDNCTMLFKNRNDSRGSGESTSHETGGKNEKEGKKKRGMCPRVLDCVFSNMSLYDADGNISATAVKTAFTANLVGDWATVVSNAVDACAANVSAFDKTKLPFPPKNATKFKIDAKLFMTCVNRSLTLNCPEKNPDTTIQTACSTKLLPAVENCDPFFLPAMQKGMGMRRRAKNMHRRLIKSGKLTPSKKLLPTKNNVVPAVVA